MVPLNSMREISDEALQDFVDDLDLSQAEALEELMCRNGKPTEGKRLKRFEAVQARIVELQDPNYVMHIRV